MPRYGDLDALKEKIQETYCSKCDMHDGIKCKSCAMDDAFDYIDNAPTADVVEVVHGRWVFKLSKYEADECVCSLCGQTMTTERGVRMNYCPQCWAKMDGKEK